MISFSEFNKMSNSDKRDYLMQARAEHSVKDILEQWGITRPLFYKIAHEVGLPLSRKDKSSGKHSDKEKTPVKNTENTTCPPSCNDYLPENKLVLSLDTTGPVSLVKNILSFIGELQHQEVRVKMEVEVL